MGLLFSHQAHSVCPLSFSSTLSSPSCALIWNSPHTPISSQRLPLACSPYNQPSELPSRLLPLRPPPCLGPALSQPAGVPVRGSPWAPSLREVGPPAQEAVLELRIYVWIRLGSLPCSQEVPCPKEGHQVARSPSQRQPPSPPRQPGNQKPWAQPPAPSARH